MKSSAVQDVWPLAPLQEGILFHALLERDSADPYVNQLVHDLAGELDVNAMRAAADALVARHASFRAGFHQRGDGTWVQVVRTELAAPWREVDLSGHDEAEQEIRVAELTARERHEPFDFGRPPLIRFLVVRRGPGADGRSRFRLAVTVHHVVNDGWSRRIWVDDLNALYASKGDPGAIPPAPHYRAYYAWLAKADREAAAKAWADGLREVTEPSLVGGPRFTRQAPTEDYVAELPPSVAENLARAAKERSWTPSAVAQVAYAAVLGAVAGDPDGRTVTFGTVVSGRAPEVPGIEGMAGLFVNTVPTAVRLDFDAPAALAIERGARNYGALAAYQYLPLAEIQRATGHPILFDTVFTVENYPMGHPGDAALSVAGTREEQGQGVLRDVDVVASGGHDGSHYPLTVVVALGPPSSLLLRYRPDVFGREDAKFLGERLAAALDLVAADPDVPVRRLCGGDTDGWRRFARRRAAVVTAEAGDGPALPDRGARDDVENSLREIFEEVLGRTGLRVTDRFFDVGGHSLLATRVVSRIRALWGVEVGLRAFFAAASAVRLAAVVTELLGRERGTAATRPPLRPARDVPAIVPLSYAQRRAWFVNQVEEGAGAGVLNSPRVVRVTGGLDTAALRSAVEDVLTRHAVLRTVYPDRHGEPEQLVLDAAEACRRLEFECREGRETDPVAVVAAFTGRAFDLSAELPVRVLVLVESPAEAHLVLVTHHIATDGWSWDLLVRDLGAAYRRRTGVREPDRTAPAVSYVDYTLWQRRLLGDGTDPGDLAARQAAYWRDRLDGAPRRLDLPGMRPRPSRRDHAGATVVFEVDGPVADRIRVLAKAGRASSFMVLQSLVASALTRIGAGVDVPVGTAIAGRTDEALGEVVGFFVNTLVLRTDTSGNPTLEELLARVRETDLDAYANQDLPFEHLVDLLAPERDLTCHPIFQVMLAVHNTVTPRWLLGDGLTAEEVVTGTPVTQFDLLFEFAEPDGGDGAGRPLLGQLMYATDVFDDRTARDLIDRFVRLAEGWTARPGARLGEIDLLGEEERRSLRRWESGVREANASEPVVALLRRRAREQPDSRAVVAPGGAVLSMREFDEASSRWARLLIDRGVRPGDVVGVLLSRSVEAVVAFTAVLKAGACYAPIDGDYPPERVGIVLRTGAPRMVVTDLALADRFASVLGGRMVVAVDDPATRAAVSACDPADPAVAVGPDWPAYVVFTSGSTGVPKGVVVPHRAMSAYVAWAVETYPGLAGRALLHSALTFDLTVTVLWGPLTAGGCVYVGDLDADLLPRVGGFTFLKGTPSHLALVELVDGALAASGSDVVLGGEQLYGENLAALRTDYPRARITVEYGPTEVTVAVTAHVIEPGDEVGGGVVPVGIPLPDTGIQLRDAWLRPVPPGTTGHVYVTGSGLSLGYHGQPVATAQRFVPHPDTGERMYHTGDLAHWDEHGRMVFTGRADNQIKLRGYRIELHDIEAALAADETVDRAVVLPHGEGDARELVAFVRPAVAAHGDLVADLRAHLTRALPAYMVPARVHVVDRFPMTPNRKLDRAALLASVRSGTGGTRSRPPRSPEEESLRQIFAEVLGRHDVGVEDDFFAAGGHSLLATKVVSRVRAVWDADVTVRRLFETPTVAALAAAVREGRTTARPRLVAGLADAAGAIPLSPAQRRAWFASRVGEAADGAQNSPWVVRVSGVLDVPALRAAVGDVLARHDILRTVYPDDGGVPHQVVRTTEQAVRDLDLSVREVTGAEVERHVDAEVRTGFDLGTELPVRVSVLRLEPGEWLVCLVLHHIAVDGWSWRILLRDLGDAYQARASGGAPDWESGGVRYADYVVWQRKLLGDPGDAGSLIAKQTGYWRDALAGAPQRIGLPGATARPPVREFAAGNLTVVFGPEVVRGTRELALAGRATVFMVLQSLVAGLLTRLGAGTDVPIGTAVAGRTEDALDEVAGFFVNTLVLRTDTAADPTLGELLERARETALGAYGHQDVPFEHLVDELAPDRDLTCHPLFQVLLLLQNTEPAALGLGSGAEVVPAPVGGESSQFDLTFGFAEAEDAAGAPVLVGTVTYARDVFTAEAAKTLGERLQVFASRWIAEPGLRLADVDVALEGDGERHHVRAPARPVTDIVTRFEAMAGAAPDATALVAAGERLTYRELDDRANRMAARLAAAGAGPGQRVAVVLPRSAAIVCSILAVLKCGAAYVPIDPEYPDERATSMLEDTDPVCVLSDRAFPGRLVLGAEDLPCAAPVPRLARFPRDPAYVMYTSGSTGRPKGIAVEHAALANLFEAHQRHVFGERHFPGGTRRRALHAASFAFDGSIDPLLGMIDGIEVHLLTEDQRRDPAELLRLVREESIGYVGVTPSMAAELLSAGLADAGPHRLVLGGEAVPPALWTALRDLPGTSVVNMYGPTECTVNTTWADLADSPTPTIGTPLDNVEVRLLDARLREVPPGAIGEIYVSGAGVAPGYHARPALTAQRFVAVPGGGTAYRTGDLASRDGHGRLVFAGRADDQLKLRGFRVEPGEIEAALAAHPGVARAVVLARSDATGGRPRLIAYARPRDGASPTAEELLAHLAATLPAYLVPAAVMLVAEFPVTVNGKLDRAALPSPGTTAGAAPATDAERVLAAIFADVLGVAEVGADADFFALGGDSITSIQLVSRARAAGLRLRPRDVFDQRTVARLASAAAVAPESGPRPAVSGVGAVEPTPAVEELRKSAMDGADPVAGFEQSVVLVVPELGEDRLVAAVQEVLDTHDLLRAQLSRSADRWEMVVRQPGAVSAADLVRRVGTAGRDVDAVVATEYAAAVARLDADSGVLTQLVWFDPGTGPGRLLWCVHHLAVDGVSWRVLVPDLRQAWEAAARGERAELAAVPTSFREWSRLLAADARTPERLAEVPHWRETLRASDDLVAFDGHRGETAGVCEASLDVETTTALLTTVPSSVHGSVNDVLLTALAGAVVGWARETAGADARAVLVRLEGHGREDLFDGVDLSRTVGWFTSLYPVRVPVDEDAGVVANLKAVKETLRRVPGNGIGCGLLDHLSGTGLGDRSGLSTPDIGFNYLGRFAASGTEERPWTVGGATPGARTPDREIVTSTRPVVRGGPALDFTVTTWDTEDGPVLETAVAFTPPGLAVADAHEITRRWLDALTALAGGASADGAHTPSDFDLVQLTQEEVDEAERRAPALTDIWPLTPLQQGLFFHAAYDEDGIDVYNTASVFDIRGALDADRLAAAAQALLDRHPVLRAGLCQLSTGRMVQLVRAHVRVPFAEIDLRDAKNAEEHAKNVADEERARRFDLADPPLLRFTVLHLGAGPDGVPRHRLVVAVHHVAMDGWSLPLWVDELSKLYAGTGLPPAPSYRDYLRWLAAQDAEAGRAAWSARLAGIDEPTLLAPRAVSGPACLPEDVLVTVPRETTERLVSVARNNGWTMNTVVQGGWAVLLGALTCRTDVVFGGIVSGRPAEVPGVESIIGLFINTIPVRVALEAGRTVGEYLDRIQGDQVALSGHHHVALPDLHRLTGLAKLFDTLLVFENYPVSAADADALAGGDTEVTGFEAVDSAHYPLTVVVAPGAELSVRLSFRPGAFSRAEAAELGARLVHVLGRFAESPGSTMIRDIGIARDGELAVVRRWNGTGAPLSDVDVVTRFLASAAERPEAAALVEGGRALTYRELDDRSARVAACLATQHGIGPGDHVGVLLPRSIEAVVAILAVARTGAAYVPVDAAYPAKRIEAVLARGRPALVLTDDERKPMVTGVPALSLAEASEEATAFEEPRFDGETPAYLVFTSGSTGEPKGVVVPRRAMREYVEWAVASYPGLGGAALLHSALTFDLTVTVLWGPLVAGGTVYIADLDPDLAPPPGGFTFIKGTPSHLALLEAVDGVFADGNADLVLGGEQLYGESLGVVRERYPSLTITDEYGPTEITVCATAQIIAPGSPVPEGVVPVGAPRPNAGVHVLDAMLNPLPPGVTGYVYVTGAGVSHGYQDRPVLTAQRFVPHPRTGERLYHTGDLAHWNDRGELVYLGRTDDQVKIRGHRVELHEIDAALAKHPGVARSVTVTRETATGQALVSYLKPSRAVDRDALAASALDWTAELLPAAMVPSAAVVLDEFPLTPNKKIDRAALPDPAAVTGGAEPSTGAERLLAGLLADLLGRESVPVDADFFALGGDSIVSIQLVSRARAAGLRLRPRDVFELRTISAIALRAKAADSSPTVRMSGTGEIEPTPAMRDLFASGGEEVLDGFEQSVLIGLPDGIELPDLSRALNAVLDAHDALRIRVEGGARPVVVAQPPGGVHADGLVRRVDVSHVDAARLDTLIADEVADAVSGLEPAKGVLTRLVWFDAGAGPGRLAWVVHHLAVDGVSWRVLVPDLRRAVEAVMAGRTPDLGPATTSLREWASRLSEEAARPARVRELARWQSILSADTKRATIAREGGRTAGSCTVALDVEATSGVLTDVVAAVRGEVNDVLLTALGIAVLGWHRDHRGEHADAVVVDLEGHGREDLFDDIDLSRTVGWFTSVHPVRLAMATDDPLAALKRVKEELRAIPDHGIGFGLLRYLNPSTRAALETAPVAEIGFNYLGRFGASSTGEPEPWAFLGVASDTTVEEPVTVRALTALNSEAPASERGHALAVTATTWDTSSGPRLQASFAWRARGFGEADARDLAERWRTALTGMVERVRGGAEVGLTPSDVGLVAVDQDELDEFESLVDAEWELE